MTASVVKAGYGAGMRIALCNEALAHQPFEEQCASAAAIGCPRGLLEARP